MDVRTKVLAVIVVAFAVFCGCGKGTGGLPEQKKIAVDPRNIEKVSPLQVDDLYPSVGTVKSRNTAQISSKVMGYVGSMKVKQGDLVKQGDVLLELKSQELESRVEAAHDAVEEMERDRAGAVAAREQASANHDLAETTYQRFKDLKERESVSTQEFDEVKARYESSKAALKRAEETIGSLDAKKKQAEAARNEAETYYGYTRVKAPFSGMIIEKDVHEGDLASPGKTLLVLEDTEHYQLEVTVDESRVEKITTGEEVQIALQALGEANIKGRVAEVISRIDPATRTFQVKLDLPSVDGIKSGMYGKAFFPMGKSARLLVPQSALAECGQLSSLYVVSEKGIVERRLVKVGKPYQDKVEILTGLDPGEYVVMRDLFLVKEGCSVERN